MNSILWNMRLSAAIVFSLLGAIIIIPFGLVTFFRARNIYMLVFIRPICRLVLYLCGIKVQVSREYPLPQHQAIYIFNHTSTFDPFILCILGLPHIRFFLSKKTRKLLPLTVMATMIGTFYTPP